MVRRTGVVDEAASQRSSMRTIRYTLDNFGQQEHWHVPESAVEPGHGLLKRE